MFFQVQVQGIRITVSNFGCPGIAIHHSAFLTALPVVVLIVLN